MKLQLTDRFCAHAKSQEVQTDYFDATVPGLALRVSSKGTKSWSLLMGVPRKRITLGRYPSVSLAAARTLALETKEGRTAGSVAALAESYLRHIQPLRSAPQIERRLRRDILPVIGHVPLRELHRRDITRVIDSKADAPIAGRRAFEDVRSMLRWAVARGDLDHSPIDGMRGPPISRPRTRTLSDAEIRQLWNSLSSQSGHGRVLKLCLVTGQRLGEVCGLRPSELDLEKKVWNIPASRTKNGHPHSVPLTDLALRLIDGQSSAAHQIPMDGPDNWPTRTQVSTWVLDHQFGLSHFTAHDLRRTVLTKMAELGVAPIVLGHVANHRTTTKAGMTLSVYVHHAYEKEKRDALDLWADRLSQLVAN
jgi:integrase